MDVERLLPSHPSYDSGLEKKKPRRDIAVGEAVWVHCLCFLLYTFFPPGLVGLEGWALSPSGQMAS
jgi:hypothetical protein